MKTCCDEDETKVGTEATELFTSLNSGTCDPTSPDFSGEGFSYTPDENTILSAPVSEITLEELTTIKPEGSGAFDEIMRAVNEQLATQFDRNRITGDQFAEAYSAALSTVLGNATQFVLNRQQAQWQGMEMQMKARIAAIQAVTANVELEKSKAEAARSFQELELTSAQTALVKLQLLTEAAKQEGLELDNQMKQFELCNILPTKLAQEKYTTNFLLPAQGRLVIEQLDSERSKTKDTLQDGMTPIKGAAHAEIETKKFQLDKILPVQLEITELQKSLTREQVESERAKTLDNRTDGVPVTGSIGKQKELYDEQIASFVKDGKHKTAKMYLDAWVTQKTLDEGLLPPDQFTNANVNDVLASLRAYNNLN